LSELGQHNVDVEERGYNNDLPLRVKLLMTIWWLANQETFRQVADRFGCTRGGQHNTDFFISIKMELKTMKFCKTTKGNAHHICMRTCELLSENAEDYIRWPSKDELEEVAAGFEFPDTVGE